MESIQISVVSPVYRAEAIVPLLVAQVREALSAITEQFEIILVEDAGPDNSWAAIEREAGLDPRVKGMQLSRNFGQHYAITAGLDAAAGEWVIVMDCDLQDKPSEIGKLLDEAGKGYDVVLARRVSRNDSFSKRLFSRLFYKALGYLTGTAQDPSIANFGVYHRKVIQSITAMREPIRYFPTMVRWVGFRQTAVDIVHGAREIGTTSYNYRRLLRLALDIILANSDKPIRLTIKFGLFVALFSFVLGIITAIRYFAGYIQVLGYTSLLISIWFLAGLILVVLGVLGLYLGKTFEGVKNRPIYLVNHKVNFDD